MNMLTVTTPFWLRALPCLAGAVFIACGMGMSYQHGKHVSDAHWQQVIAQNNADNARELAQREANARQDEQDKAGKLHAIDQQHIQDNQNEIVSRDRIIADLHAGTVSLRDRFTCHAGIDQRLPSAAATTGQRDAASAGGLSIEDASLLISESARADQAVMQLKACQAVVRADRGQ